MTLNYAIQRGEKNTSIPEAVAFRDLNTTDASVAPTAGSRGYSAVFEEIWRTHANQLLRMTKRITNNREDAEDALQESFLRAYIYLHNFDNRSSLTTWLTRIAINSALTILRKRASAPQISIDDAADLGGGARVLDPVDGDLDPEARYAQAERMALLHSGLRTLPPSIRQAIEIQALEDSSVKQTAKKMGLSVSAIKSRIFHAKAALRRAIAPSMASPHLPERPQLSPA